MTTWSNWSGLEVARPREVLTPATAQELVAAVDRARRAGTTLKPVGAGHSFTGIAAAEDVLVRPDRMQGLVDVDRKRTRVTARAGTRLKDLNAALEAQGLSLHNMGDIAEQTLAGAVSTGTHGSGGLTAGLAAQVTAVELVTGTGEVVRVDGDQDPALLDLVRVGLGALGVLTEITFAVEPLFLLRAEERPVSWSELLATFDDLTAEHHHVDVHWFPHTDGALLKANSRLAAEVPEREPLSRARAWLDDDFLSNRVFGATSALGVRVPALVRPLNRVSTRALSPRTYSDVAHRVFVSRRDVVFREMEYAVPREVGLEALAEARRVIDRGGWAIGFPVEVRTARAESGALATAYQRDSLYLAFHVHRRADHTAYFREVEQVMRAYEGRPHWGKLHTLGVDDLVPLYPRLEEFLDLRDRWDPDRVLGNPYLRRVLGQGRP